MSLTKCIAEMLNKIPAKSLDGLCPDWFAIEIKNGRIQDVVLKKECLPEAESRQA